MAFRGKGFMAVWLARTGARARVPFEPTTPAMAKVASSPGGKGAPAVPGKRKAKQSKE